MKKIESLLLKLSSAYQEQAIEKVLEYCDGYTKQEFADACCDEYRDILKSCGYDGNKIYTAFRRYGDECELQSIAYEVYDINYEDNAYEIEKVKGE